MNRGPLATDRGAPPHEARGTPDSLEVLIVGGGPLGLALALALEQRGMGCLVADARPRGAGAADRRVLALSHGSRQILERLQVWASLPVTPIDTIHVSQQGGLGRTVMRAADYRVPALGYVVDAGALAAALERAALERGVRVAPETSVGWRRIEGEQAVVTARHADGTERTLRTRLVAFAEGAVTDDTGVVSRDYGQHAVVVAVTPRQFHGYRAWERFTAHGPVALLPHGERYAAIIARPTAQAERLLALPDTALCDWLQQVFGARLGFDAVGARAAFPLGLRYRREAIAARVVWLGNAAQTLHPVAGQGFNLALRDAWQLAELATEHHGDCGDATVLRRYQAARRWDRAGMIRFTDALVRVFSNAHPLLHHARGGALLLLDLLPAGRDFLARRMMFGARS